MLDDIAHLPQQCHNTKLNKNQIDTARINRTVLEDATNTKSHGNQRLHVQWWKAPDDGYNSDRNM
jgi:hypothetical protein